MANRGGFADLLAPGFMDIFFQKWGRWPEEWSKVFTSPKSSKRKYEDTSEISGLGAMGVKEEGAAVDYEDPVQRFDTRFTHVTYGLGTSVSRELWEDDLYGIMNRVPAALAISGRQAVETVNANHWNRAFSSSYTGGDSIELCATDHPLIAGTEQNELTTAADLSVTSLEALVEVMEETQDEKGLLLSIKPNLLIVPPELQWEARELLDSLDKPYTGNNEINPLRDVGLKYFVYHYLTDPDAFFLQAADHYMTHIWRRKPRFTSDDDFDTEDAKFKATMRFSSGFSGWRGVAGSPGA